MSLQVNLQRVRTLAHHPYTSGTVCYWMSRDQRVNDNWALLLAQQKAQQYQVPLIVCFVIVDTFLGAGQRQYQFMIEGLQEVEQQLESKNIPFCLLVGEPVVQLTEFVRKSEIGALVTDFSPLRIGREWRQKVAANISIPMVEVDAHNIVPCWVASPKQEFAAYTFRPKIHKLLPSFLENFPPLEKQATDLGQKWCTDHPELHPGRTNWEKIITQLTLDPRIAPVDWIKPGEKAAHTKLNDFIEHRLPDYGHQRNDPTKDGQSNLSPYLHFGHISAQRVALAVEHAQQQSKGSNFSKSAEAFLEELIIRRELSDNFCFYNQKYDQLEGAPEWARRTLSTHASDPREFVYTLTQLEHAQTHDPAWNAAQMELVTRGKMHGYMRMYWAKKILEWSVNPTAALQHAITLNDRYLLDGRDPNGYVGILWSIAGLHDRAWFERPIFGQIRYMNFNGLKRKFAIDEYIHKWLKK